MDILKEHGEILEKKVQEVNEKLAENPMHAEVCKELASVGKPKSSYYTEAAEKIFEEVTERAKYGNQKTQEN